MVIEDSSGGNITFTLPSAIGRSGKQFVSKKGVAANSLIVATTLSQTIDGATTQTIAADSKGALTFHSDGANWYII